MHCCVNGLKVLYTLKNVSIIIPLFFNVNCLPTLVALKYLKVSNHRKLLKPQVILCSQTCVFVHLGVCVCFSQRSLR